MSPPIGAMYKGSIRAAWPVAAATLDAAVSSANWLLGRGVPLVIDGGHSFTGFTTTQTRVFHYRYQADDLHPMLGATFVLSASSSIFVTINSVEYLVGNSIPVVVHQAVPNSSGNAEATWTVTVQWEPTADAVGFFIHQLSLYECPAVALTGGGVEPIRQHLQVYDGYDARESISGLARAAGDLQSTYFRRGTVFNFARGDTDGRKSQQTGIYDTIFSNSGILPAVQNRLMYNGETTRNVNCNVYARVSSGATGSVQVSMTNGATATFAVTSTSNVWHTTQTLAVETDDPTRWESDGGIRGGSRDFIQVGLRVASGGQTVYLLGVSVWDAPG